jgi:serine/threonine protein kinase
VNIENQTTKLTKPEVIPTLPLRAGTVIDGRYEITKYLDCGGMGSVYRARHLKMDRDCAIKTMHPRYTADVSAVKRFQREARIISGLRHANILTIYSFGGFEGLIYLAMEFVQGKSLGQLIAQRGRLNPEQALPLLLQICDGMTHAHNNDVLHRDLKPDNVMVIDAVGTATASVKIVDFGLATLLNGEDGQRLTRTGEVVGDPRFMSPEQCRGEKLDVRSDVYSFGCLMYEVLTGILPFDADHPAAILNKHVCDEPEPFAKRLELPLSLEAITFTAMAKTSTDRYESFETVAQILRTFLADPTIKVSAPRLRLRSPHLLDLLQNRAIMIALACLAALSIVGTLQQDNLIAWCYRTALSFNHSPTARVQKLHSLAQVLERQGQLDAAASQYETALAQVTDAKNNGLAISVQANLADFYYRHGNRNAALNVYEKLLSEIEDQVTSNEVQNTDIYLVIKSCERIRLLNPSLAVQRITKLAMMLRSKGKVQAAEQILEVTKDTGSPDDRATVLFHIGTLQLLKQDYRLANSYFDRALNTAQSQSCRAFLMHSAAAALHESGYYDTAIQYYSKLASATTRDTYPRYARLLFQTGECYVLARKPHFAQQAYRRAVNAWLNSDKQLDSELLPRALHQLGKCEESLGRTASAAEAFRQEANIRRGVRPKLVR